MKLVFVSSEVAPFSKSGGLGDVCGSLPRALAARGHTVLTVSPAYGRSHDYLAWDSGVRARFWLGGAEHEVAYRVHAPEPGLQHVLVDHLMYRRPGIYGDDRGSYGDNLLRFALLARAALEVPRRVPVGEGGPLGEDVTFHVHDWPSALLPVYLRALYQNVGLYPRARSVLSIHNAAHQGRFPSSEFSGLDLSARWWSAVEWDGHIGLLKAGLVAANRVSTVSPSFAEELRTPGGGFGLEGLLRHLNVTGILNGIDTEEWDPEKDPHIAARYTVDDLSGKAECKAQLQRELGLPVRPEVPLLAVVTRLDGQKGIDSLLEICPWLLREDVQLVVLGSGQPKLESGLREFQVRFPQRMRALLSFDVPLSHRIYAAADIVLMPSVFEPCGLTQMYGMRYGAVPVVRAVGGLRDSVKPWNPLTAEGTGWAYGPREGLGEAIWWAVRTWWDHPRAFAKVRENGMRQDWSWSGAARAYEQLYGD